MLEELLKALGVATVAEAMSAINRYNQMVDDTCTLMAAQSSSEALASMRAQRSIVLALETSTGAKGAEVLARVEAWKASAEQLTTAQAELGQMRKTQERTQADALIETATREMRLVPALRGKAEEFYSSYGIKALETYLTSLPQSSITPPSQLRQPAPAKQEGSAGDEWTADDDAYCKATGRTKDEVLAARKLWTETQGVVPNAHLVALNKKASQPRA